jgi:hypothetical protein
MLRKKATKGVLTILSYSNEKDALWLFYKGSVGIIFRKKRWLIRTTIKTYLIVVLEFNKYLVYYFFKIKNS